MAEARALNPETRRLAVYSYLRPLLTGRRVLELGCGDGQGAMHLVALGARSVVAADGDGRVVEQARARHRNPALTFAAATPAALEPLGPFDLVLAPDGAAVVRGLGAISISLARRLLGPRGRLVCAVENGDRAGAGSEALPYYDLVDALSPHFASVRMFGQTSFVAFGIAEFDEAGEGLRLETGLSDANEEPAHYLAVAGPEAGPSLGYALVQVPFAPAGAAATAPRELEGAASDLRRQLAEAQGQAEGALRVSRAQAEEIEELRARLRRAAEARAELDEEVARLRRSLTEADESVLTLTRRTTEEMTALAQRLTSGLRGRGPLGDDAAGADLRRREAELAARESALSDRDERIALLEAERQDLLWRLEAAEEQARHARTVGAGAPPHELEGALAVRDQALEEYRRAAVAHVDEVARLRDTLNEQATLVAELEDALEAAEARARTSEEEAARLRRGAADAEEADRSRRSRLAELEGTLLRLQHQKAPAPNGARAAELETELRSRVAALESALSEARFATRERDELRQRLDEVEARADVARLESAIAEVGRLHVALERSEEQLWETKHELEAERLRLADVQRALVDADADTEERALQAASISAEEGRYRVLLDQVLGELAALEAALRAEAAQVAAIERSVGEWRGAQLDVGGEVTSLAPES